MKKAFTLIELLIVIAIIGILAAILFVSIGQSPLQGSRDAKRVSDLQSFRTALSLYYADNGRYPVASTEVADGTAGNCVIGVLCPIVPKYTTSLPRDPLFDDQNTTCITPLPSVATGVFNASTAATVIYAPMPKATGAPDRFGYTYATVAGQQAYLLKACLENQSYSALASDCDDTSLAVLPCTATKGPADATHPNERIYELHS